MPKQARWPTPRISIRHFHLYPEPVSEPEVGQRGSWYQSLLPLFLALARREGSLLLPALVPGVIVAGAWSAAELVMAQFPRTCPW